MFQNLIQNNPLIILYCSIFFDFFSVGIIIPLLPYYVSNLGADIWIYGLLGSTYGISQLIGYLQIKYILKNS